MMDYLPMDLKMKKQPGKELFKRWLFFTCVGLLFLIIVLQSLIELIKLL
jgi:hypothetical protein